MGPAEVLKLLEEIQHCGQGLCPVCFVTKWNGHAPDCRLAASIAYMQTQVANEVLDHPITGRAVAPDAWLQSVGMFGPRDENEHDPTLMEDRARAALQKIADAEPAQFLPVSSGRTCDRCMELIAMAQEGLESDADA